MPLILEGIVIPEPYWNDEGAAYEYVRKVKAGKARPCGPLITKPESITKPTRVPKPLSNEEIWKIRRSPSHEEITNYTRSKIIAAERKEHVTTEPPRPPVLGCVDDLTTGLMDCVRFHHVAQKSPDFMPKHAWD